MIYCKAEIQNDTMTVRAHIDIKENELLKSDTTLLEILLKDMTTDGNLVWATDN